MSPLVSELRRRKVVQLLTLYGAGGFCVLGLLRLGEAWAGWGPALRIATLRILVLGLPFAFLAAWVLQVTPEGMRAVLDEGTGGALGDEPGVPTPWFTLRGAVAALLLLVLGAVLHVLAA